MTIIHRIDDVIARHAVGTFDEATPLVHAGIESLSILRIISEAVPDPATEIDLARLVDVHTIGDLRGWLREMASRSAGAPEAAEARDGVR
ncbi:hypothetical protein [Streptosporangium sp. CA-115845]|uniref:hypothetical protein n=1 Tax=Streptosporangium sp. CA-115845 TaxID=3240071 RepID=UPI003D93D1BB